MSGEDIVKRIILDQVDLSEFDDNSYIALGPASCGGMVYTSFTKKEYLEELQKVKTLQQGSDLYVRGN